MNAIFTYCVLTLVRLRLFLTDVSLSLQTDCMVPVSRALILYFEGALVSRRALFQRYRDSLALTQVAPQKPLGLPSHFDATSKNPSTPLQKALKRSNSLRLLKLECNFAKIQAEGDLFLGRLFGKVLTVWARITQRQKTRCQTLRDILASSPVSFVIQQLAIWLLTPTRHLSFVLGDFEEGFTDVRNKHGLEAATAWGNEKIRLAVRDLIANAAALMTGWRFAEWLYHQVHRWF